ncbi:hypothetical protein SORBI_3008G128500 [Sorghum bicolor]|uniref:Uncharacterized protein n=1 Tax=Sorghum bicolor TaxID=4558 RepID=A0A1B6PDD3_SORBI|nr:hypothetical protein SORBI_3008G128500 [Sorghum bicolor]
MVQPWPHKQNLVSTRKQQRIPKLSFRCPTSYENTCPALLGDHRLLLHQPTLFLGREQQEGCVQLRPSTLTCCSVVCSGPLTPALF